MVSFKIRIWFEGQDSSPGLEHCAVFLGKMYYFHSKVHLSTWEYKSVLANLMLRVTLYIFF